MARPASVTRPDQSAHAVFPALTPPTLDRIAIFLLCVAGLACLTPGTPPWLALLGGLALALTAGNPVRATTARAVHLLLPVAVVGLGAGVDLGQVLRVGGQGLGYTLAGLAVTFALGLWLGRRFGIPERLAILISAGTGICGGSAIAAVAPVIGAAAIEMSAALATVFLLNGVALVIFPLIGTWAGLDAHAYGLWCALAIHDTSSVTGAALAHGQEALTTATTVKLARALWIAPVALILGAWAAQRGGGGARGVKIPWFIGGFIAMSALFTFLPGAQPAAPAVLGASKSLLTLNLFLIGAGLDRKTVRTVGARPFLHGVVLWVIVAGLTLALIRAGWIH